MTESGVCPRCGESVNFFVHADSRTRICPNCGKIMDVDDIIKEEKE